MYVTVKFFKNFVLFFLERVKKKKQFPHYYKLFLVSSVYKSFYSFSTATEIFTVYSLSVFPISNLLQLLAKFTINLLSVLMIFNFSQQIENY